MNIGYARVSRTDQNLDLQEAALEQAGCERIRVEKQSGAKDDRPVLLALVDDLRPGDVLVVWKLDRLGRSLGHLIGILEVLGELGVQFRSLTEGMDTTTPAGRLLFHVAGAFAQFERDLTIQRTHAGLAAARARGRLGGRPAKLSREDMREIRVLYDRQERTVGQIARRFKVSRPTIYRALARMPTPDPIIDPAVASATEETP